MSRIWVGLTGWVLAALMVGVLSVVCFLQMQRIRGDEAALAHAVSREFEGLRKRMELSDARWSVLVETLQKERAARLEATKEAPPADGPLVGSSVVEEPDEEELATSPGQDAQDLPSFPPGLNPQHFVKKDLTEILSDPKLNSGGKELTRIESARARLELGRAQSLISILDGEIRLEYNLGMEELRQEGLFTEYRPGERYQKFEGVLTAGEALPGGGMRMFYLYPERFPGIYEKRAEKRKIAETAMRRLLAMLQAPPEGG